MNNTTTIQTEVDTTLHNQFTKHMNRLTTLKSEEYLGGRIISQVIDAHLYSMTKPDSANRINKLIERMKKAPNTPIPLHINHIHPQTHKKFIKYLQKKYKTRNIKKHYNTELEIILLIYLDHAYAPVLITHEAILNASERKEYDKATLPETHQLIKEEFTIICNEYNIIPEKVDIYGVLKEVDTYELF